MQHKRVTRYALFLTITFLAPVLFSGLIPRAHAATYSIGTIPFLTQEGGSVTVIFTVSGATGNTLYSFRFFVRDPATVTHQSVLQNYTTLPGQTQFTLPPFNYPTASFPGPNSLVGQYITWADQVRPVAIATVAATYFLVVMTDKLEYQRTETVNVRATGYKPSEIVSLKIATATTSTTVFTQTTTASPSGVVTSSWQIPRNATLDSNGYVLTVNGTLTVKTPADVQGFNVKQAVMSISALASLKSTYQRTETMSFSFQPVYPDGTSASTGFGLVTLARPDGVNITLTTSYSIGSQTFNATYKTSVNNQTGTWTASLAVAGYTDAYGNSGPNTRLTSTPQLVAASLTISVSATTFVPIGQQMRFNATIYYPDGTQLKSGSVGSYMLYTGTPQVNETVPVVFDTGLQIWVGSYTPKTSDPGGLWSLIVNAGDAATPTNGGSATKAVTLEDRPPTAAFSATPSTAPTGTSISFDGTASNDPDGTITSYSWNFGDTTTGSGSIVGHSYSLAGIFTVTLTVTDNGGLTASTSSQVTITDRPPVVSFTPSPSTATTGQVITLTITSSDPDGSITTTRIDWGDGMIHTISGAATTDTHSYASTGSSTSQSFTISIMVTDNNGSTGSSSSTMTISDQRPTVSFTPSSTSLVTGQNVTLTITAADPDGSLTAKQVDWGDGNIDTLSAGATTDSHSYGSTGSSTSKTITITVSATDNSGSIGSSSSQITVSDRAPTITFSVTPATASTGETVIVSIRSSDPDGTVSTTMVDWGDGTVDTLTGAQPSDTHTYTLTGSASSKTYTIAISVTDNSGSVSAPSYRTVDVQSSSQSNPGVLSLPLYLFGILAAILAALIVGGFLAFRRHKVTHARLKIDLEAVKSEAGRIENQEFFQSVKDQLKKDKND